MSKKLIFFILFIISCIRISAITLQDANRLYEETRYNDAALAYNELLKEADNHDGVIEYNLANTYYKLNNYPQAILYYRKAFATNPCDPDFRFNMNKAMEKIENNVAMSTKTFVWRQIERFMHFFSWEIWAIAGFCSFLAGIVCFFFHRSHTLKKMPRLSLYISICFFISAVINNCLFLSQYFYTGADEAVVMKECQLRAAPNIRDKGFKTIAPGTVVNVSKESEYVSSWSEIQLPSGERGWVATSELENV